VRAKFILTEQLHYSVSEKLDEPAQRAPGVPAHVSQLTVQVLNVRHWDSDLMGEKVQFYYSMQGDTRKTKQNKIKEVSVCVCVCRGMSLTMYVSVCM
jgi:hypothetical protein